MKCQRVVQELRIFSVKVTSDSHVSKASSQVPLFILFDLLAVFDIVGGLTLDFILTCRTPHSLASPSMSMTTPSPHPVWNIYPLLQYLNVAGSKAQPTGLLLHFSVLSSW